MNVNINMNNVGAFLIDWFYKNIVIILFNGAVNRYKCTPAIITVDVLKSLVYMKESLSGKRRRELGETAWWAG